MKLYEEGQEGPQLRFREVGGVVQVDQFDPTSTDFAWTHIGHFETNENGRTVFVRDGANSNMVEVDAEGKIVCV